MMGYESIRVAGFHDPIGAEAPSCRCEPPYPLECPGRAVTLPDFLLARIAEDERKARHAFDARIEVNGDLSIGRYIAHFDPARAVAECGAKRRIVELHELGESRLAQEHPVFFGVKVFEPPEPGCQVCVVPDVDDCAVVAGPCLTLRLLAQPYADHPDFRAEWAVSS
jgi:hypothetical protein